MQDDLYKEDKFFVELLNSGDRKRQCEYRNAVIKAIVRMEKARDDGSVTEALQEAISRQDLTERVIRRVFNFFRALTIVLLANLIGFIALRVYLFQHYASGTLDVWMIRVFPMYCGDGSVTKIVVISIAVVLCFFYTFLSKGALNSAIAKSADTYIVSIPMESDFDEEITESITGNTYSALLAKRDALDGVLWGGVET